MTPVEILALIFIVIGAIKILAILKNPKSLRKAADKFYSQPTLLMSISLILAALVLNYLILAGITIVQMFAVMLFFSLLMIVTVAPYSKNISGFVKKITRKGMLKKSWLPILIWIILIVWGIYALAI